MDLLFNQEYEILNILTMEFTFMKKTALLSITASLFVVVYSFCVFADTTTLSMTGRHLRYYQYNSTGDNVPKVGAFARGGTGGYCDETVFYAEISSINNAVINSVEFRFKIDSIKTPNQTCTANLYEQNKGAFSTTAVFLDYPDQTWNSSLGSLTLGPSADLKVYSISATALKNLIQAWASGTKTNRGVVLAGNFGDASLYWKMSNAQLAVDYTPPNSAPVASSVSATGLVKLNETLTGSYTYSDAENNTEGNSLYKWYRADNSSGSGSAAISGATGTDYSIQDADYQKYLCFEATPIAQTGTIQGTPVKSSWVGPVTGDLYFYPKFCGANNNMKVDLKAIFNGATPPENGVFAIKSNTGNFLQLEKSNGGFWTFYNPPSEDWLGLGYTLNNFIQNDFLAIGLNGNIGIGTHENLNAKLCVDGKIKAREVQVTSTGWADYVLKPDYNLRTLPELETFIKENGTLPGIPSEKEVKENGIPIGEMQQKLLAKIEELSLYMISIQKENVELKDKVNALEKKMQGN